MNILIVCSSDIGGGAARAAYRLHQALQLENINSKMLVQNKISDDYTVTGEETKKDKVLYKLRPLLDSLPLKFYKSRTQSWFSPSLLPFSNMVEKINALEPDVVHLHWINEGMLSITDIAKIKAPIVWSLHDMWAFTGGCHYDEACGRYVENCGYCNVLGSTKEKDLSRRIFEKKEKAFAKIKNLTIVGLSSWITQSAQKSTLFKDRAIVNLPNLINTNRFRAIDKSLSRELLDLPKDKKLILFGAIGATSDPRKGHKELAEAIKKLNIDNVELVVIGSSEPKEGSSFTYKTHFMGHLHDDVTLQLLYSAVDVTVVPSLQENLSNVIMESMSCGTPVVAFDIGGNGDMIEHKVNGYLAKSFDTDGLAIGISWVLADEHNSSLSQSSREKVVSCFDSGVVVKYYVDLYEQFEK